MYLEDHNPPHFHAIYGDHEAQVAIADGRIIEGELPRDAARLDGTAGEHDFSALVRQPGPVREPLRDPTFFEKVFLEFGAPTWPNGYDMGPEWLRREMAAARELRQLAAE